MSESKNNNIPAKARNALGGSGISRKSFLKYAGASAATVATLGLAGCEDEGVPVGPDPEEGEEEAVKLGTGDVGILNYAYALEQLEAAFYIQVTGSGTFDMSSDEGKIMEEIRDHEIAHRDWFGGVIAQVAGKDKRIPALTPNFSDIDFSDRNQVLTVAQTLEDTGVSAYNGAGHLISVENADPYLIQAGKIVSVEARHASVIRSMTEPGSFYNKITADTGLDAAASPTAVLGAAGGFIKNKIDASGLPKPADVYL